MDTAQIKRVMHKRLGKKTSIIGPANSIHNIDKWKYIILNTDCACHSGSHWVSLHKIGEKHFEFFDSFGRNANEYNCLQSLSSQYRLDTINTRLQNYLTAVCGQYALFFLIARKNGHAVKTIYKIFKNKPTIKNDIVLYRIFQNKFKINSPLLA
jgi:hypothetical protein